MTLQIPRRSSFEIPFYVQVGPNDRTPMPGIAPSTIEVYLKKPAKGLAPAVGNGGVAVTDQGFGLYTASLDPDDTDTVGSLIVLIDAGPTGFAHLVEAQVVAAPQPSVCRALGGTAGAVIVSGLSPSQASDHWSGSHLRFVNGALAGQQRRISASIETIPFLNGASYDDLDDGHGSGDHLLFLPGAFALYTPAAGDKIILTSGAGIVPGTYPLAAKVNDDAVLLGASAAVSPGTDSPGDVVSEGVTVLTILGGLTGAPAAGDAAVIIAE